MNQPSNSDIFTKLDTVIQRIDTLDGRIDTLDGRIGTLDGRIGTLDERVASLAETVATGFDNVERTLAQHSFALLELSTVTTQHTKLHREHSAALGRIETRQRSESHALDDHEQRIKALEQRPYPPASAR